MAKPRTKIIFGTRRSRLARWQTEQVLAALSATVPNMSFDTQPFDTMGDRQISAPLPEIGGKGLFTAELDEALRNGTIDAAVHSLKDLPCEPEPELVVRVVLERADPRDVLVTRGRSQPR